MHNMPHAACYLAGYLLPVNPLACWMLGHSGIPFALPLLPAGAACLIYNTAYVLRAHEISNISPMCHCRKSCVGAQVLVVHTHTATSSDINHRD